MSSSVSYRPKFSWRFLLPGYWLNWLGLFMFWCISLLPRFLKRILCRVLSGFLYRYYEKRRHIVLVNLRLAFPRKSAAERAAMAKAFFYHAACMVLDMPLLWWGSDASIARRIKVTGQEHLVACKEYRQPVILLTCHMLGLEYGALGLTQDYESVGLIKPARNKLVEWLVARGRTRFKGELFQRDAGIRAIVRAIKLGKVFYYLPDEDLSGKAETLFAPFFAERAASLTALGRLSRLTGAAVLPATTVLDDSTGIYQLRIFPPLENFPTGDDMQDVITMNQQLEKLICIAPSQYMWSLRLYQSRPGDKQSPYE